MSLDLIVEIGNSHDGSLGIATSMVDMAREAGASTVKFQMHLAEYESTPEEPFRKTFSKQDKTRFAYWKRVTFDEGAWKHLIDHTTSSGMEFMCSPFSLEAAKWLDEDNRIQRWKVGSGEATNFPLLDFLIETKREIVLSTGLISWRELLELKTRFESKDAWDRVTLLHCVSMYPVPLDKVSLNVIHELRKLTSNVGFSDHSGDPATALFAYSLGVSTIEVHLTPNRLFFGPDTSSSLTPDEIRSIIQFSKKWDILKENGFSRDQLFELSSGTAKIFRKGLYWKRSLAVGHVVTIKDLSFLKPSSYVEAKDYESILGLVTSKEVHAGSPVKPEEVSSPNV